MRARAITSLAVLAGVLVPALPGSAAAAPPLLVGLQDDRMAHVGTDPTVSMARIRGFNARIVRVDLRWDLVATRKPANPTNPKDPAYDWRQYDRVVAAARRMKLRPLMAIWGTPAWAADPTVASSRYYPDSARRPRRPADAGAFATAAARRYARRGVRLWEMWNEPNLPLFLRPQYRRVRGRWIPESPRTYTAISRAMFRGIKRVDRRATISGAVTGPIGDRSPQSCPYQPDCRMTPTSFVLNLNRRALRPPMDAVSHHPYPIRRPARTTPPGRGYVDLYNFGELTRTINRTYLRRKPIWLTEFGFATRRTSQYPFHVSEADQARYLADAFRRVRRIPRVRMFVWYLLQDHPDWASGLLDERARAKPAAGVFARWARAVQP
ncbi:MAG: hypothetical protein KDC36_01275 [Thermoleophilia bacterium]|nr:hypothetical protein [Thermoleophilia bacterium]